MDKQMMEIEKAMAFQERTIEELKDLLMAQQKQINTLEKELDVIRDKLTSGDLVRDLKDEEPPPHY